MKALVTGGSGFVGSNLARELVNLGHEVTITGNSSERKVEGVKTLHLSFAGLDWNKIKDIDVLFHQAANNDTLDNNEHQMMIENVYSPLKLFKHAYRNGCRRFVYASSTAVYGNSPAPYIESETQIEPLNAYAKSKQYFDDFAMLFSKAKDVKVVGLRYCNVYGPGEGHKGRRASMIYQLAKKMLTKESPKLFRDGEQKRDWIYVKDVVKANLLAAKYDGSGIFNCGTGVATSFNNLVKYIDQDIGILRIKPEYIDNPYEKAFQNFTQCDMSLAKKELGFTPDYDIRRGIKGTIDHIRSQQ
ncbi:MAG: NAD-dependent epimerase/dehydratase family protein [Candidatus Thorarchaeota archaeon]|jgi:ADP-L-glycero-D-manno-heptose 6-epimerase